MKKKSQVESGKAFEYGLALRLQSILKAEMSHNDLIKQGKDYFEKSQEQEKILQAADKAVRFLSSVDKRLGGQCRIQTQSDKAGSSGDVRDLIIENTTLNTEIGISAKNRHNAAKHSRLSQSIDFGKKWLGYPCSDRYFEEVKPVFEELSILKNQKELFRNIPNKEESIYLPILTAFKKEFLKIHNDNPDVPSRLIDYLVGKYDFYKIVKENGDVSIQSFNLHGTLLWGKKIPKPTRIIEAAFKSNTKNTLLIAFDGWQVSFRIHNASSRAEPSLKFDVRLIGMPPVSANHILPIYND